MYLALMRFNNLFYDFKAQPMIYPIRLFLCTGNILIMVERVQKRFANPFTIIRYRKRTRFVIDTKGKAYFTSIWIVNDAVVYQIT